MAGPISRRLALTAAVTLGGLGGLAGIVDLATAATRGPRAPGPLRVGYLPITDASPLLVAHEQGHFSRAGADTDPPVLFRGWESLAQAFLAGEVDVVHLLMPFAVQLRYALGARVRIIAWSHTNGSALTVSPQVRDIGDLAGRKVAVPFWWSIHNVVLQQMLRAAGLRPVVRTAPSVAEGTVQLLVMSPADMLPALTTDTISGYIVADPFNAAAELKKAGRVQRFVGDVWRDHACCVVMVREDLVNGSPQVVQGLTDGLAEAQRWVDGNRVAGAKLLSDKRYLPQPLPAITKALTRSADLHTRTEALHNPSWQGERIGFTPFPFPSYTAALVTAMRETVVDGDKSFLDTLQPAAVHRDLVDDRFIRRSLTRSGGAGTFGLPESLTRVEEVRPQ
jgi:NitT/TauT family transport system substrate-binding protein